MSGSASAASQPRPSVCLTFAYARRSACRNRRWARCRRIAVPPGRSVADSPFRSSRTEPTAAAPGSVDRIILAVKDIQAARADLVARGVDVSAVDDTRPSDSAQPSYFLYASYKDPDGNGWLLQQITSRLPGREWED